MSSFAFDRVKKASRREKSKRQMQFQKESLWQHYHKNSSSRNLSTKTRSSRSSNANQIEPLDNFSVMTRLYGSVWPRVSLFCLFNTAFCALIWAIDRRYENIDLSIDPSGHKYLASLLSFLVIARVRIMYNLSIKARENLSVINQNAHDLVETAAVLTHENTSDAAMEWRRNVALRVIEFLVDCMDALSYNSDILDIFTPEEAEAWRRMSREDQKKKKEKQEIIRKQKFRKPTLSAMALKKAIYSHRYELTSQPESLKLEPLVAIPQAEMRLVAFVEASQDAFYTIKAQISTPFPFPLVQMGRMILIFWVVTLPFALQHSPYPLWGECMLIFLITFGFFGLECVCIDMSDPFGTDENDFDQVNLARITFEDIYLTLFRYDGHEGEVSKVRKEAETLFKTSHFFCEEIDRKALLQVTKSFRLNERMVP